MLWKHPCWCFQDVVWQASVCDWPQLFPNPIVQGRVKNFPLRQQRRSQELVFWSKFWQTWSHFPNLYVPAQIALSRKVQGPWSFRGEPELSGNISMNRWWSFLSCLTSLYDTPLPFSPTTEILCRGSLGEMDKGRDFSERKIKPGLQTVCRPVALIYAQLQGKKIPSVFHKLVSLNAPHRRPVVQTWWKSFFSRLLWVKYKWQRYLAHTDFSLESAQELGVRLTCFSRIKLLV